MSEHFPPRILLTGASGQLGFELLRSLRSLGDVVATARHPRSIDRSHGWLPLDLADHAATRELVAELRPQVIVNAGAYTAVDRAETELERAFAVNGEAPGVLAEEAARLGALLIHYSTDYVFDGRGTRPWTETDAANPLNAYGATKLAGEQVVAASGALHVIVRTSWIFSHRGANFLRTMLRLGAEQESVRVVDDQFGAPTSARVIADITGQMLAQARGDWAGFFGPRSGLVHLASSGETSWFGFAQEIFKQAAARGLPLRVRTVEPICSADYACAARRPLNSRLDCRRLHDWFALEACPWQTALADALDSCVAVPTEPSGEQVAASRQPLPLTAEPE